jgi:fatty-acyl-CoA synthase
MYPEIATRADIERLEERPLSDCMRHENIYQALVAAVAEHGDRPAIIAAPKGDPEGTPTELSYREFLGLAHQTANMLGRLGLGHDDVVSFLLPLCPEAYAVIFGGAAAGIVNAVNPFLEPWQIGRILKAAGTKVLVVPSPALEEATWDKIAALKDELPDVVAVIAVGGPAPEGALQFDEEVAKEPADRLASGRQIKSSDIAAYFHTGGTTGTPKLAQHTHHMQASQIWTTGVALDIGPGDAILVGLPLFHIGGSVVGGVVPLSHGATLVIGSPDGFRDAAFMRSYWRLVRRYGASVVAGVPTVIGALLNIPFEAEDVKTVRYALTGGSPLPVEVGKAFTETFGQTIIEGYGMTETTSYVTMNPRNGESRFGSAGLALPHVDVKVAELGDGRIERFCDTEEIGNVVMRGDCIMSGYVQSQFDAEAILADGWLNSGDLGRLDAEGYLWITGRSKDLIIRGGHNIDPSVIEETVHQHPAVEMAAAVGRPDAYAGEIPIVYVQYRPGQSVEPEELQAFVRERIPERAANPASVFVLDEMPLTGVGKIFKPALRWDATKRVFSGLMAPIAEAEGFTATVDVGAHDSHGTLATITLSGVGDADRPRIAGAVATILAPFAIHHEITWG